MEKSQPGYDLPKLIFAVGAISILIVISFWVLSPFLPGFVWAGMIVIATWPVYTAIRRRVRNSRWIAASVMVMLIILLFVFPLALLINSIVENSEPLMRWVKSPGQLTLPELYWLDSIPVIGPKLFASWTTLVASGGNAMMAKIQPYLGQGAAWFLTQLLSAGKFLFHLAIMLLFSALLYLQGEEAMRGFRHFALRLAGMRGDAAVLLAAMSVRAVALGVVVTALTQAIVGGLGLGLAGVPFAAILTVLIFICCVAQLGPLLIMIPSIIYLFWTGDTTWAVVMIVWAGIVATMDGVLRPYLIKMGADLPMVLILTGVIGGMLSLGMIGLFIGPVVLAVSYTLLKAWMNDVPKPSDDLTEVRAYMEEQLSEKE
ncbi:AI-2E family transporter YdiK [Morganella morganii]|uniref:AI-2E family transporter YdiK n=1 Tax=Morganella morganii TaxID=582 RepID=UPI0019673474|nr:AI-2E family transporter YdiK [Morganella morganii]EKU0268313.1 AI-2E family transporter YdiK [Morganella morganii]ELF0882455.1 AI-2E family transporter YdiK [Morganella morganii]MBT0387439.1 AI-2E family transporter YdiK [Morganella morganii subsp. morganii]MBT0393930.1 AI-2E family transporter YdiK [Morganella morganii subsp. morganii]MBT0461561.1 AI-2E family transporter YdiK [Morganella morganii subsp. morganii]